MSAFDNAASVDGSDDGDAAGGDSRFPSSSFATGSLQGSFNRAHMSPDSPNAGLGSYSRSAGAIAEMEESSMRSKKSLRFRCGLQSLRPVAKCDNTSDSKTKTLHGEGTSISNIIPGLYLGGARDASCEEVIRRHRITHIIDLTPESRLEPLQGIEYLRIQVLDNSDAPIRQYFDAAFAHIDKGRAAGAVLVHCQRGVSRSATIVIAFLMRTLQVPYRIMLDAVRSKRPIVAPNLGFNGILSDFERDLGIDTTMPVAKFATILAEFGLSTRLGSGSPIEDDEEPSSPQTAPAFASLGFT